MSSSWQDFRAYFLLCLGMTLDQTLLGRSWNQERIYDLGEVSRLGLKASFIDERLGEIFHKIPDTLSSWGFDPSGLSPLQQRFEDKRTQADEMIAKWIEEKEMKAILGQRILA